MIVPATQLPASPIPALRVVELAAGNEPALQHFFEANPAYFLAVNGERVGVEMGRRTNTLRLMIKPLAGAAPQQYLSIVPRDRPEAPGAP